MTERIEIFARSTVKVSPGFTTRLIAHGDNLDGLIERG